MNGILTFEAMRIAQEKFGNRTLTGDEFRWGFEHLQLDPADVEKLGAKDLFHSINVTCDNHEGDGLRDLPAVGWHQVECRHRLDRAGLGLLRPIIEKSAEAYAAEKGITPRDCAKEMADQKAEK